ncbi:Fic-domain-containing protein [Xylariaceae sp. FL1272]|nr:Fic-domain-containing protein [Xylariaceae sp. FL1272]
MKTMSLFNRSGHAPGLPEDIVERVVQLIYSSNFIEVTGTSYAITDQLCRKVFNGEKVGALVEDTSPEYHAALNALLNLQQHTTGESLTYEDVIRSRQEVINHAEALCFAIDQFVLKAQPFSEVFLQEVHRKLCSGVINNDAGQPGQYRTWEVAARHGTNTKKKSKFIRHSAVPDYMAALIKDLENDLATVEKTNEFDVYDMASRYCHRFVCIHPFGDGNGRVCRIILNVILLKYGGFVTCFGGSEEDRREYLDLAQRASRKFYEEDMEVPENEKIGHRELTAYIIRKSSSNQHQIEVSTPKRDWERNGTTTPQD